MLSIHLNTNFNRKKKVTSSPAAANLCLLLLHGAPPPLLLCSPCGQSHRATAGKVQGVRVCWGGGGREGREGAWGSFLTYRYMLLSNTNYLLPSSCLISPTGFNSPLPAFHSLSPLHFLPPNPSC